MACLQLSKVFNWPTYRAGSKVQRAPGLRFQSLSCAGWQWKLFSPDHFLQSSIPLLPELWVPILLTPVPRPSIHFLHLPHPPLRPILDSLSSSYYDEHIGICTETINKIPLTIISWNFENSSMSSSSFFNSVPVWSSTRLLKALKSSHVICMDDLDCSANRLACASNS